MKYVILVVMQLISQICAIFYIDWRDLSSVSPDMVGLTMATPSPP